MWHWLYLLYLGSRFSTPLGNILVLVETRGSATLCLLWCLLPISWLFDTKPTHLWSAYFDFPPSHLLHSMLVLECWSASIFRTRSGKRSARRSFPLPTRPSVRSSRLSSPSCPCDCSCRERWLLGKLALRIMKLWRMSSCHRSSKCLCLWVFCAKTTRVGLDNT